MAFADGRMWTLHFKTIEKCLAWKRMHMQVCIITIESEASERSKSNVFSCGFVMQIAFGWIPRTYIIRSESGVYLEFRTNANFFNFLFVCHSPRKMYCSMFIVHCVLCCWSDENCSCVRFTAKRAEKRMNDKMVDFRNEIENDVSMFSSRTDTYLGKHTQ